MTRPSAPSSAPESGATKPGPAPTREVRTGSDAALPIGFQVRWVKEVARGLEKYVESASRRVSRAATRRVEDAGFSAMVKAVDAAVTDSLGER